MQAVIGARVSADPRAVMVRRPSMQAISCIQSQKTSIQTSPIMQINVQSHQIQRQGVIVNAVPKQQRSRRRVRWRKYLWAKTAWSKADRALAVLEDLKASDGDDFGSAVEKLNDVPDLADDEDYEDEDEDEDDSDEEDEPVVQKK